MMHGKGSAATLGLLGAEYAKDLNFKKVKGVEVMKIDDQSWKQARNDLVPGSIIRFETQQPQYTGPNKPLTHIGIVRPDGKIAHLIGSTLCIDDKNSITNNYKPRQIITRNDGVKPEPFDTQNSRSEFEAGSTPERLGAKIIEALPNLKGYGAGFVQEIVYQLNREKFETKIGTGSRGKPELRAELKEKTKLKLPKDWY
jgi:hypothetical protein